MNDYIEYLVETMTAKAHRPGTTPWWAGLSCGEPAPLGDAPDRGTCYLDEATVDELVRLFQPYPGPWFVRLMIDALYPADADALSRAPN